jgi:uncharacterized protein (DUF983 family)
MPIKFHCPSCRVGITLPDEYAGLKAKCKACGYKLIVPGAAASAVDVLPAEPSRKSQPDNPWTDIDAGTPVQQSSHGYQRGADHDAARTLRLIGTIIVFVLLVCCLIPARLLYYATRK